jgi:predicted RNase H-like HicB family nuclease
MSKIEMTAVFEPCDEGGYIAYIEEIPGINSQGETIEDAKENLTEAINLMFEERRSSQIIGKNKKVNNLLLKPFLSVFSDGITNQQVCMYLVAGL